MSDPATIEADLFSKALQSISPRWSDRQRASRRILTQADPITRLAQSGLLRETVAKYLEENPLPDAPLVVFMDRFGGGEGARAAGTVIELLAKRSEGVSFVHVSFATPPRGLGTLLRANLARKGSDLGVLVDVVAHNVPPEGLKTSQDDVVRLFETCDLAISFAPDGVAGLTLGIEKTRDDLLLANSHVAVLSFPDPEFVVADLPLHKSILSSVPGVDSIRYWAQQKRGDTFDDLGHCILGPEGNAEERLWVLLDNAKRGLYRFLVEPMLNDLPAGDPTAAPCKTLIEKELSSELEVLRFVSAGNRIIAACRGRNARPVRDRRVS